MANILFYTSNQVSPSLGGVERVISVMNSGLSKFGHKIIISYFHSNSLNDNLTNQIKIPFGEDAIIELIKDNKIDLCINFIALFNKSSAILVKARSHYHFKLISVYHNSFESLLWNNHIFSKFMNNVFGQYIAKQILRILEHLPIRNSGRSIYNKSDMAVVLAESYIRDYKFYIKSNADRLVSIYNPMPIKYQPISWDIKENIVLFVGRLDYQKGLDKLLRIWRMAERQDWMLVIVGSGPLEYKLKTLAKKYHIEDSVKFIGHQDPKVYYSKAKIFAMSSIYEGFPMVLIESMGFGCVPIIFDSYSAAKEITKNVGYLIEPFDEVSFAAELSKMIESNSALMDMSHKATNFSQHFNSKRIINQWNNLITSLIN